MYIKKERIEYIKNKRIDLIEKEIIQEINFEGVKSSLSISQERLGSFSPIPETCIVPNNIRVIDLCENQLQGQIRRSWTNCMMLEHLVL